jgi:methylated-DNA-[protein]-cysteine S-methyltransferase
MRAACIASAGCWSTRACWRRPVNRSRLHVYLAAEGEGILTAIVEFSFEIYFRFMSINESSVDGIFSIVRSQQMSYIYRVTASPIGKLKLVANGSKLSAILWEHDKPSRVRLGSMHEEENRPILVETERQLNEYFAGKRNCFELELEFVGTEFQKKVWQALLTIPFGETRSYGQIATQIGNVKAVRAVGAANGKNPISIIAPCHRVIGASGDLTGYAGGLGAKKLLLALESGNTLQTICSLTNRAL